MMGITISVDFYSHKISKQSEKVFRPTCIDMYETAFVTKYNITMQSTEKKQTVWAQYLEGKKTLPEKGCRGAMDKEKWRIRLFDVAGVINSQKVT